MTKEWCIEHRDGWCATANGNKPEDAEFNVETKCGWFVVLPLAISLRKPTCPDCEKAQEQKP